MKDPLQVFTDYIVANGLKMTPQRMLIVDVFLREDGHLTTEELYEKVKREDPSVGQATVYRTMKLLSESGIAKEVRFGDGVARYEQKYGSKHHDHLICETCGRNIEVLDEHIELLQEELAAKHGFVLTSHRMYLYGECRECRDKKKKKS
ncbi:ferric uptake regulation protein [Oleidesulfovibrio alaskensis G20]|jgi:Fur family ferric uptake transcriptional regulator|uniref:Ferric uptake regulation protein n=1 Tax=Oleidesulfovibrio alaskensis (strain ATCC BAA-1058 / DSM 17464 / G20) TaxID=207559 RepID=Q30XX4_OLEA2|nr:Fur family transcriptional regulator [Oleidesulfovibrio alaskensis]ABB39472.1 ferric uptake regulation protein [Oleidesulfovibrio alaskensis G20]MBG0772455.1 transcriptional repressor [Oleidesulfovibrio alaskensis]MBL3582183.1 transcriptional repressor [Oleidesulfovibrio alaskensis]